MSGFCKLLRVSLARLAAPSLEARDGRDDGLVDEIEGLVGALDTPGDALQVNQDNLIY